MTNVENQKPKSRGGKRVRFKLTSHTCTFGELREPGQDILAAHNSLGVSYRFPPIMNKVGLLSEPAAMLLIEFLPIITTPNLEVIGGLRSYFLATATLGNGEDIRIKKLVTKMSRHDFVHFSIINDLLISIANSSNATCPSIIASIRTNLEKDVANWVPLLSGSTSDVSKLFGLSRDSIQRHLRKAKKNEP